MARRKDRVASSSSIISGYSDLAEIGASANATVYRATEIDTGRQVAVKVLTDDSLRPYALESFQKEIHALATVSDHPNIVTLYRAVSSVDGRPAMVLELCRESLADQLRNSGALDSRYVVRAAIKVAGALETAHRSGFLHCDLKPENILVTQFDQPALVDFRVASLRQLTPAALALSVGSPVHAPPEMLEGRELSPATDVYGLASTMYQLVTGHSPFAAFDGESPAAIILRILRDPIPPIDSAAVPIGLSDLLSEALAKEPVLRPSTAADFAEGLRRVELAAGWPPTAYVAWSEVHSAPPGGRRPRMRNTRTNSPPASAGDLPPLLSPATARAPIAAEASPGSRNVVMPDVTVRGQPTLPVDAPDSQLSPLLLPPTRNPGDLSATGNQIPPDPTALIAESVEEPATEELPSLVRARRGAGANPVSLPRPKAYHQPVVVLGMAAALVVIVAAVLLATGLI